MVTPAAGPAVSPKHRHRPFLLTSALTLAAGQAARGEDHFDFKNLYYQEDGGRIRILEPSALWEKQITPSLTLRLDAVYDSISGASPTGAPPVPVRTVQTTRVTSAATRSTSVSTPAPRVSPAVYVDDDDEEEHGERDERGGFRVLSVRPAAQAARLAPLFHGIAGATPVRAPTPAPVATQPRATNAPSTTTAGGNASTRTVTTTTESPGTEVPKADATDTRVAFNLELEKRLGDHTPVLQLSHSTENDYVSTGVALRDAISFNRKNTTLLVGAALNNDEVEGLWVTGSQNKRTVDAMIGVTQVLSPETLLTANVTAGRATGYLNDPYKIVELNSTLVPEKRPDSRDKTVVFLSLNRYVQALEGGAEVSYRWYDDTFGVRSDTLGLAWYQKLGPHWIIRPQARYYRQSAADFYDVWFSGNPENYSADYRLSELEALGYGLKLIWKPNDRVEVDVSFDRYEQRGTDGQTSQDAYPSANFIMAGLRLWL